MNNKFINGSTLKILAIISMITDHIGAALVGRLLLIRGANRTDLITNNFLYAWCTAHPNLSEIYHMMRSFGRIAFPIYCFLLVEGFTHTKDLRKYIFRLGLFALISEIPFDLAFQGKILEFGYQNVFFTLLIGLITLTLIRAAEKKFPAKTAARILLLVVAACFGMAWANLFQTDYAAKGVMCILVFYFFRKNKILRIIAGALAFFWWEPAALFAFIPIAFYNERRGLKLKYLFYIIYPAHLLLLYLFCAGAGIASIPVV